MGYSIENHRRVIMTSLAFVTVFCLASTVYGLPQSYNSASGFPTSIFGNQPWPLTRFKSASVSRLVGLPATGPIVKNIPGQGPAIETDFGMFKLDSKNAMSPRERAQYLPVMKALLKVLSTKRPSPQDINTLLVLTRDLSSQVPKGRNLLGNFGNFGLGNFGDFSSLESMGLPKTGNIITTVDGVPNIKTEFGTYPLSDVSLMTDKERATYLPVVKTLISVLQKDDVDPNEINTLLEQSRDLVNAIPNNPNGALQGFNLGNLGGFLG